MKTISKIYFIISLFCIPLCADTDEDGLNFPPYDPYINAIISTLTREMSQELGLYCVGDGGRMPHDVEEIGVMFHAHRRATVEEAREIEIKVTERLLAIINADEKIRPFLREYPFPSQRAEIHISFINDEDGLTYADGSVAFVFQTRDVVHYRSRQNHSKEVLYLFSEPYLEALQKVGETTHVIE